MNKNEQSVIDRSTLYVVSTPIGNLGDITYRALEVLKNVDLIAAEDTRHTAIMLQHFLIKAHFTTLYDYNEKQKTTQLLKKLQEGQSIALVSNAGTPLINDPGYHLVRRCHESSIRVVPIPGACAASTALCASGIASDRFCYEGFLPKKSQARKNRMKVLAEESRTLIFYESTHRLVASLEDMVTIWGPKRYVVLARELTKTWESIYGLPVGALVLWVKEDDIRRRGEIVLIVTGYKRQENELPRNALRALSLLQNEMPLKRAAMIVATIYGIKKNALYKRILEEQSQKSIK